ncbi:expressed unknown protein (Partial), partial [Seminavis robusta]
IKAEGGVNLFVPVAIQQSWLELLEKGRNRTLLDFGFFRRDGYTFGYEDQELTAKLEHYLKLNRYVPILEAMKDEERDHTIVQVLADASDDVPCLFHVLQKYPYVCSLA